MREGRGWCSFAEQIEGVTAFSVNPITPVGFCDHTAGGFLSTMRRASFWNGSGHSVHFAIGRDGVIIQIVNIFETAWAQGALGPVVTWPPYTEMGRANPNSYLISTEHEDAETVNRKTRFIPGSEWTQAQYDADLRVKRWCVEECAHAGFDALQFGLDSLAGHHLFDGVNRPECPGRFWRDEYRARLFHDLGRLEEPSMPDASKEELNGRGLEAVLNKYQPVLHGGNLLGEWVIELKNKDGSSADPPIFLAVLARGQSR